MERWHLPVGNDFEIATDKVKDLKKEHDAIIAKVKAAPSFLFALRREGEACVQVKEEEKAQPLKDFMDGVKRGEIGCYAARAELAFEDAIAVVEGLAWQRPPDFPHDLQKARKPSVDLNFNNNRSPKLALSQTKNTI